MDVEFDPIKDAVNVERHGVSLAIGERIFGDADHIILPSIRPIDGEDRFGLIDGKLFTAVHVVRAGRRRFISVRRSNDGEERSYRA